MTSLKTTAMRWMFNFFPAFRNSGARITFISEDLHVLKLKLPLRRSTRNYVGTIYGGSMYSALDGLLMVMFIRHLGADYIVWDKSGRIEYLKPGRSTLYAEVAIDKAEISSLRARLATVDKLEKEYTLEWRSADGVVCCRVHKLLYFRRRTQQKQQSASATAS